MYSFLNSDFRNKTLVMVIFTQFSVQISGVKFLSSVLWIQASVQLSELIFEFSCLNLKAWVPSSESKKLSSYFWTEIFESRYLNSNMSSVFWAGNTKYSFLNKSEKARKSSQNCWNLFQKCFEVISSNNISNLISSQVPLITFYFMNSYNLFYLLQLENSTRCSNNSQCTLFHKGFNFEVCYGVPFFFRVWTW